MRISKKYFLKYFPIIILLIVSCSCPVEKQKINEFQKIAEIKYGEKYISAFNSDSTYILCTNPVYPSEETYYPSLNYFIYDIENKKIIADESFSNVSVNWIKKYIILVKLFPEAASENENENQKSFIFNVKTLKKIGYK